MSDAHPAPTAGPVKLKYIDALRGLAILAVIMVHCGQTGNNRHLTPFIQYVILQGANGVALFYFVSAYTLMHSMHSRISAGGDFIGNFYIRRFFRIAPLFYVAILYYLWQDTGGNLANVFPVFTKGNVASHLLLAHGVSPWWINTLVPGGWSVANEVFFYIILPLLFFKINNTQRAAVFFLAALYGRYAVDFIFRKYVVGNDDILIEYSRLYLPANLPVFALGILYYFIVTDSYRIKVSPAVIFLGAITLLLNIIGLVILPGHVVFTIAIFILAIALSKTEFKLVVNPVLTFIGKISYSVYLSHFAVFYWMVKTNSADFVPAESLAGAVVNFAIRYIVAATIAIAISSVLYKFIELPMQRLGYRIINRKKVQMLK
jgi:peptidoglycan/LPS O-acetylase OafA/YrhL